MNCLAGIAPRDADRAVLRNTYVSNLRYASARARRIGHDAPHRTDQHARRPGFYLNRSEDAFALMKDVGADNLKVQYDLYHMRIMGTISPPR